MKWLIVFLLGIAAVIYAFREATVIPDLVPMPVRTKPARLMPGAHRPNEDRPQVNIFATDQRPRELNDVPPPAADVKAAVANEAPTNEAPFIVDGTVRPMPFKMNMESGPPAPDPKYPVDGKVGHIDAGPYEPKPPRESRR